MLTVRVGNTVGEAEKDASIFSGSNGSLTVSEDSKLINVSAISRPITDVLERTRICFSPNTLPTKDEDASRVMSSPTSQYTFPALAPLMRVMVVLVPIVIVSEALKMNSALQSPSPSNVSMPSIAPPASLSLRVTAWYAPGVITLLDSSVSMLLKASLFNAAMVVSLSAAQSCAAAVLSSSVPSSKK